MSATCKHEPTCVPAQVKLYGSFVEHVKNDPVKAAR